MLNDLAYIFLFSSVIIQFFYYFYFFLKLTRYKNIEEDNVSVGVSVIICARNEADNLFKIIPAFLAQEYKNFELIVVNDKSIDESKYILNKLQKSNKRLKIVNIDKDAKTPKGKKFALTMGIKSAIYDYILLSDADCIPHSRYWISSMASCFKHKDIVLGYGAYEKKSGVLNNLIRYDTFIIALQYFSFSLRGCNYMGVGRNLGYKKSLFFKNKGFASHINIPSGDDDLFIQEISSKNNVAINTLKISHTISYSHDNIFEWIKQKRRHITTSKYYKKSIKFLLLILPFSQFLFWVSFTFIISLNIFNLLSTIIILFKFLFSYLILNKIMRRLNVFDLYIIHPLLEVMYLLIQVFFVILNMFKKYKNW